MDRHSRFSTDPCGEPAWPKRACAGAQNSASLTAVLTAIHTCGERVDAGKPLQIGPFVTIDAALSRPEHAAMLGPFVQPRTRGGLAAWRVKSS